LLATLVCDIDISGGIQGKPYDFANRGNRGDGSTCDCNALGRAGQPFLYALITHIANEEIPAAVYIDILAV